MPKRTNYFQQLIHHVYRQLAPVNATVTESALLKEQSSDTQREIDILVECPIAGHMVRIGIECRDRTEKDDITWVDGVIGKYQDLDIQKVILVSNSGFSEGAIKKALAHHIEVYVLKKFDNLNVYEKLNALRMTFISRIDQIQWVVITTEPQQADKQLDPSLTVYNSEGEPAGNLNSIALLSYERFAKDHITSHINQNMDDIFPQAFEFDHEEVFKVPMQVPEPFPYYIEDEPFYIVHLLLSVKCIFQGRERPVDNYWYNQHHIAVAHITDTNKLMIVQKSVT